MDLEPDRCRRTDGRKWRCSKNVVQNQKYCEGHMHRGSKCSRKHVEFDRSQPSKKRNGFVPKSVLGEDKVSPGQKSVTERTDLNQDYCEMQKVVGAKRVISGPQQHTSNKLQATLARATAKSVDKSINLNNYTGSSSDVDTISDEKINFCVSDYISD
ncbi:growth-regulating factor 7 [Striga asiatica]|uniref:Growth-regulating factor n=1 Tax=Striga asiatica TaxID=4170 RepID=A0A5A7PF06_STRAF|nr:growth-regulating factor 7 [Striga asiatica]